MKLETERLGSHLGYVLILTLSMGYGLNVLPVNWSTVEYIRVQESISEYTRVHWNTLECTGVHWSTLEYTSVHWSTA